MRRVEAEAILERFANKRVLVVGDLMADEFVRGHASRISPEAPVLVLDAVEESFVPGGAANVAAQLLAFGAEVVVAGVVGDDATGNRLRESLTRMGADCSGIVSAYDRPTTQKTRIVAGTQQLVRVDREKRHPLPEFTAQRLVATALQRLSSCDALLFSDYDKGVLTQTTIRQLVLAAEGRGTVITANPKPVSAGFYEGILVAQLNRSEADSAARLHAVPGDDPFESADMSAFHAAGVRLRAAISVRNLLVTRSSDGLTVFHQDGGYTDVPAHRVDVFDGTGAGDSTIAGLTLALASGASLLDAVAIGNASGGAVVRKVGVATATREEVANLFA
ncbi:MAG: PfkB family carbohydrate kinase [Capsulimonadales bacterium]|nr:PfkB family carbohydrate kinase [Capsulimonadales bacterium]